MPKAKKAATPRGISTEEWIKVARETLIKEGLSGLKIDRLARKSNVTRGGFYYRFTSLQGLLDALIEDWKATNCQSFLDVIGGRGTPAQRFQALVRLWLEEQDYNPDYDTAIRAWSQIDPKVAEAVHEVDDARIEALRKLFVDAGYDGDEAFVRARISYFHQVGYYAMGMRESDKRRAELSELYYRVLTGFRNGELKLVESPGAPPPKAAPRRTDRRARA